MKIVKVTPFLVDKFLFVRVYTDAGIVGTGEAGLWAHHRLVYEAIRDLGEYYVGKDPSRIEHHFQTVSRDTHFMGAVLSAALSAMDVALWDILGKATNRPIHQLLGGKCRDKVRVFANVVGNTLEQRAKSAAECVGRGYTSLRTMPFFANFEKNAATKVVGDAVAIVRAIREAVGYEIDLGLEIHRNLNADTAIMLANELLPFRILYYEDALMPQSLDALRTIAPHIPLPMANGERLYNLWQFKELLDTRSVTLIRPDLSLAGGYTQLKKIAGLAEAAFVGVFPHLMGSNINTAAFVQFDAAIPNYVLHECNEISDVYNELLDQPLQREGGWIIVPDRPGIGVDLVEEKLARFPFKGRTIVGNFGADGAVAH